MTGEVKNPENDATQNNESSQFTDTLVYQVKTVAHLAKEYFTAINPKKELDPVELMLLGQSCTQAGLTLMKEACDKSDAGVEERLGVFRSAMNTFCNFVTKVYLNEDLQAKMVAMNMADKLDESVKEGKVE